MHESNYGFRPFGLQGSATARADEVFPPLPTVRATVPRDRWVPAARAESTVEEPVEDVAEAPTEELAEAPVEDFAEAPTEELAEAPVEELAQEPAEELAEAPVDALVTEPLTEPAPGGLCPDDPSALFAEAAVAEPVIAEIAVSEVQLGPTGRPLPDFPTPPPLDRHGPAKIIAMCNQKGGVGKTTSAINLGAAIAEHGRRVLLVDFDPQGSLGVGLGINPHELELTLYNLLLDRHTQIQDVLLKTNIPGVDLLPCNIDLSAAEVQLVSEVAREQCLQRALAPIVPEYDVIIIDCQPSLGLLTVNALTAANVVLVPLECEYFALRGVALLADTIEKVQQRLNPELRLEGILATMFDSRTLHAREVLARVVEAFGDVVFHTVISRTVRFPETTVVGEPITSYASASNGAKAYRQLALEVLARATGS